jgi:outer membrane protein W
MKHLPFFLIFLFTFIYSFSQKNFIPGYLLQNNGDSLHVYLQEEFSEDLVTQVKYKKDFNAEAAETFYPGQILGFGYENGNIYKSISFLAQEDDSPVTKTCFANQLVKGNYNPYAYVSNEETYYVVKDAAHSYFLSNTTYQPDGGLKFKGNYQNQLILLSVACDQSLRKPELINYNRKELTSFISALNHCVDPDKATVTYYHKDKLTHQIILFAGGLPLTAAGQVTVEALARFTDHGISKNVSLNAGIHYSNTVMVTSSLNVSNHSYETSTRNVLFCVPFTIQYNFTSWIIQPYVAAGISAAYLSETASSYQGSTTDNKFGLAVIGEAGIEGYVTSRFLIKAAWRYELVVQYPAFGLAYKF